MMGRRSSCSPPFAALSSHMLFFVFCSARYSALLCILLCPVFCSFLYFALLCILLCPVFCSSLYFALLCILLCLIFCSSLYYVFSYFQISIVTSLQRIGVPQVVRLCVQVGIVGRTLVYFNMCVQGQQGAPRHGDISINHGRGIREEGPVPELLRRVIITTDIVIVRIANKLSINQSFCSKGNTDAFL